MSVVFTFVSSINTERSPGASKGDAGGGEIRPSLAWRAGFQSWLLDPRGGALASIGSIAATEPMQLVLTHATEELDPVTTARKLAALQLQSSGRIALRVPARGQANSEQQPSHIAFWRRVDEYLTLLKRLWVNEKPIDHEGPFYSVAGGFVPRKGARKIAMPIRMGGLSGTALNVVGRHADIFELAAGSPDEARLLIGRVRAAAARYGRQGKVRFALPIFFDGVDRERPDSGRIVLSRQPAQAALQLLTFVDAGVSEFLVSGLRTVADLDAFEHVASFVQNSLARREAAWAASAHAAAGCFDLMPSRNY